MKRLLVTLLILSLLGCNNQSKPSSLPGSDGTVHSVGAMRNVMWNGALGPVLSLDTLIPREGLYGLGPESYLRGELLIVDGQTYVSRVVSDSTMQVSKTSEVSAPFFVYGRVMKWKASHLSNEVHNLKALEAYLDAETQALKRPFVFMLKGTLSQGTIHIQNLPMGTKVSSPQEAHQGQVNYELEDASVTLVGFFSKAHQGVFTHHDSYMHVHLLSEDETQMGHLDAAQWEGGMKLYLPEE
ncbi:MAG TPA: acetolactate decarboxylase [Flavobacteriaceae bacterium]|nr:acetolactate decarboxylase [Flavobacteriaceae bacterium]MCB9213741.1 acetolactate decarboxylase [Alteromonas sp.]HPF12543.1 acetolactate decarboxylase [Flavobacteriaceae bacterium]HQU22562.1 acetolactate decarboxylase [Flavobacteriaceae bacterium]HQU66350.1 acetolactate decarboxylase [Flavobacteriaceae bacterium]